MKALSLRSTRLLLAAALASTVVAFATAPAAKADNVTGGYNTGSVHCYDSTRMVAYPPSMTPASVTNASVDANGNYLLGVGGGTQDVGFQAVLQRWTGSEWKHFDIGSVRVRTVSYVPMAPENWYDTRTKTWTDGTTWFGPMQKGYYYRVVYYLYWFFNLQVNFQVSGQLNALPADGHFDNRADKAYVAGWSSPYWCFY